MYARIQSEKQNHHEQYAIRDVLQGLNFMQLQELVKNYCRLMPLCLAGDGGHCRLKKSYTRWGKQGQSGTHQSQLEPMKTN